MHVSNLNFLPASAVHRDPWILGLWRIKILRFLPLLSHGPPCACVQISFLQEKKKKASIESGPILMGHNVILNLLCL